METELEHPSIDLADRSTTQQPANETALTKMKAPIINKVVKAPVIAFMGNCFPTNHTVTHKKLFHFYFLFSLFLRQNNYPIKNLPKVESPTCHHLLKFLPHASPSLRTRHVTHQRTVPLLFLA